MEHDHDETQWVGLKAVESVDGARPVKVALELLGNKSSSETRFQVTMGDILQPHHQQSFAVRCPDVGRLGKPFSSFLVDPSVGRTRGYCHQLR